MENCLFCKIANKEIDANIVYEDDQCIAFYDVVPAAPVHILIIPKVHIDSLAQATDEQLTGHLLHVGAQIAKENKDLDGYRVVVNTGKDGGQTVQHLHVHLLAGRAMTWPAG